MPGDNVHTETAIWPASMNAARPKYPVSPNESQSKASPKVNCEPFVRFARAVEDASKKTNADMAHIPWAHEHFSYDKAASISTEARCSGPQARSKVGTRLKHELTAEATEVPLVFVF